MDPCYTYHALGTLNGRQSAVDCTPDLRIGVGAIVVDWSLGLSTGRSIGIFVVLVLAMVGRCSIPSVVTNSH